MRKKGDSAKILFFWKYQQTYIYVQGGKKYNPLAFTGRFLTITLKRWSGDENRIHDHKDQLHPFRTGCFCPLSTVKFTCGNEFFEAKFLAKLFVFSCLNKNNANYTCFSDLNIYQTDNVNANIIYDFV